LITSDGKLAGIGDADGGFPGNMFMHRSARSGNERPDRARAPVLGGPWLRANLQDLDGQFVVRRVAPEGPAAGAGVQHGDRVVAIDGSEIRDLADFYRAYRYLEREFRN
jgi:predicted metalloprotease with PDZ domain